MDVFPLLCHCSCGSLNFASTCSLRLNALSLAWHLQCPKRHFGHTCSVKMDIFLIPCSLEFDISLNLQFRIGCVASPVQF